MKKQQQQQHCIVSHINNNLYSLINALSLDINDNDTADKMKITQGVNHRVKILKKNIGNTQ